MAGTLKTTDGGQGQGGQSQPANEGFNEPDFIMVYRYREWMERSLQVVGLESPTDLQQKLEELKALPARLRLPMLREFMYASVTQERRHHEA